MKFEIYQIDAFTDQLFSGNPAAVVPLEKWLEDDLLQKIAAENNLSETAFYVSVGDHFHIRWYTPTKEVALCGHATLAAAYVIDLKGAFNKSEISFDSKSGILNVKKLYDKFILDLPIAHAIKIETPIWVKECFEFETESAFQCDEDILLVYENESIIKKIVPDFQLLKLVKARGVIISAEANDKKIDFVSRFFAPTIGIDEDSVTGSTHALLAPYWGAVLNKKKLVAKQISKRGGELDCEVLPNRIKIGGRAKLYLIGFIEIN